MKPKLFAGTKAVLQIKGRSVKANARELFEGYISCGPVIDSIINRAAIHRIPLPDVRILTTIGWPETNRHGVHENDLPALRVWALTMEEYLLNPLTKATHGQRMLIIGEAPGEWEK